MEVDTVEIIHSGASDTRLADGSRQRQQRLRIQLSQTSETPKAKGGKHFSFSEVSSPPSLEASVDMSSASSVASDERLVGANKYNLFTRAQQAAKDPSPPDEGCVTDRVVRFFCPFESIPENKPKTTGNQNSQHGAAAAAGKSSLHLLSGPYNQCTDFGTSQDCTGAWLKPVEICIPEKWDNSPERNAYSNRRLNIRNRCSTLKANERKAEHINQIRNQWHSTGNNCGDGSTAADQVLLRSTRSERATQQMPLSSLKQPSTPSAYYDSDPEIPAITPRYKRNRPTSLNFNLETDASMDDNDSQEFECPRVPRRSTQELQSFFESPRSITDAPNFDNDAEVREFIQIATEQRVNLVWHQGPKASNTITTPQPPPLSITGWFEYGSQLDNVIVFPKFVWRQAFQPGTNLSISRVPNFIPLLTIVGVIAPYTLDRRVYPFARLDRSCCIHTHDGREFVFEASSPRDRDLFVTRLKVLVARLASSVIVHDERMLREFFSPTGTESFADYDDGLSADDCCSHQSSSGDDNQFARASRRLPSICLDANDANT